MLMKVGEVELTSQGWEEYYKGLPTLREEFARADLGRASRNKTLDRVVKLAEARPERSLPQMSASKAEREMFYRFFGNEAIEAEKLLEPHVLGTVERAKQMGRILAVHDTSGISYGGRGKREGLGYLNDGGHGYFLHLPLAVSADGWRVPLGVLGFEAMVREKLSDKSLTWRQKREDPNKESRRWNRGIDGVEALFAGSDTEVVHVLDREGDDYELVAEQVEAGRSFVIRQKFDRLLDHSELSQEQRTEAPRKVREVLEQAALVCEREVRLSARRQDRSTEKRKTHPARDSRIARLCISAAAVRIKRPAELSRKALPAFIELNIVHVWERDVPEGLSPVEWYLMSPLPIDTEEQILQIVDFYRARWVIEELFKALKTGCAIEKRQLESKDALLRLLAVFLPIAHRLLLLRSLPRTAPNLPASIVLTNSQLTVLRLKLPKHLLPPAPTVQQALFAVAALGGHFSARRFPGWQVLGRGYEQLILLEQGFLLASGAFS
jgi:IS4 transposase